MFANNTPTKPDATNQNTKGKDAPSITQEYEVLHWCASEAKRLLAEVKISQNGIEAQVNSDDIAILVRSARQAKMVKAVFNMHQLSTVYLSERSSLFLSQQALDILWLLQAVNMPSRENTRKALTTSLLTFSQPTIHRNNEKLSNKALLDSLLLDDDHVLWADVYSCLSEYKQQWQKNGIYGMLLHAVGMIELVGPNAERSLTNYLHIAELLANAAITCKTPLQLIYWLHQQITAPIQQDTSELRLESDEKVIKIVTQHKSKGLEYPFVFLPFANNEVSKTDSNVAVYHDENFNVVTELGVSEKARKASKDEARAEDMRLLYVSLTRPILRCYVGITALSRRNQSAIMRALGVSALVKPNEEPNLGAQLCQDTQNCLLDINQDVAFMMADDIVPITQSRQEPKINIQHPLNFNGAIKQSWHVSSFSRISGKIIVNTTQKNNTTSLGKDNTLYLKQQDEALQQFTNQDHDLPLEYRFNFPKGPEAGNFLHDLLEYLDFSTSDLSTSISEIISDMGIQAINNEQIDVKELTAWLSQIMAAPILIGQNFDQANKGSNEFRLLDLYPTQVLKESEFYFPINKLQISLFIELINIYRTALTQKFGVPLLKLEGESKLQAGILEDYQSPNSVWEERDELLPHAEEDQAKSVARLNNNCSNISSEENNTVYAELNGVMHGFIDLIFEYDGRYYVADYKSNFLGERYDAYSPKQLCIDMLEHQYDVQYLIYCLALHRYLKVNLTDYKYDQHFGGVYYFYLRGMGLKDVNKSELGIFSDKIDASTLHQLDELFTSYTTNESTLNSSKSREIHSKDAKTS